MAKPDETADYYRGYQAGLERAAKYHDDQARDCRAIAAVNGDNDLGPDCETHAIDHDVAADEIRAISEATKNTRIPAAVSDALVESLGELYLLCCAMNDFRPDSQTARKVRALLSQVRYPVSSEGK